MRRLHRAFTLIELIIVLAILTILAALIVPAFQTAVEKSRAAEVARQTKATAQVAQAAQAARDPEQARDAAPFMPAHYLTDDAGVLSAADAKEINEACAAWDKATGAQLLVYIGRQLPADETVAEYGQRLFRQWKPGQKGVDNGVLLILLTESRKARIQTGYGMEATLPDAICKRIISDKIAVHTKNGKDDWASAAKAGVMAITALAKAEPGTVKDDGWNPVTVILVVLIVGVGIVVLAAILSSGRRRRGGYGSSVWDLGGGGYSSSSSSSSGGSYYSGGGSSGGGGASGDL